MCGGAVLRALSLPLGLSAGSGKVPEEEGAPIHASPLLREAIAAARPLGRAILLIQCLPSGNLNPELLCPQTREVRTRWPRGHTRVTGIRTGTHAAWSRSSSSIDSPVSRSWGKGIFQIMPTPKERGSGALWWEGPTKLTGTSGPEDKAHTATAPCPGCSRLLRRET